MVMVAVEIAAIAFQHQPTVAQDQQAADVVTGRIEVLQQIAQQLGGDADLGRRCGRQVLANLIADLLIGASRGGRE